MSLSACTTTAAPDVSERLYSVLGVTIIDTSRRHAVEMLLNALDTFAGRTQTVCFVNAHTLNVAADKNSFRDMLDRFDFVFGDGTGVRLAARLSGIRLTENLVGTDLVPLLLDTAANRPLRVFLLGGDEAMIRQAAREAAKRFPGATICGFHHGYLADSSVNDAALVAISAAAPDILLVGMGNPIQEQWIEANRDRLCVPLAIGVGGLFHYWAGDLQRAPQWLRRIGAEWLGILLQQPKKAKRYLVGNPLFLGRIFAEALRSRRSTVGQAMPDRNYRISGD